MEYKKDTVNDLQWQDVRLLCKKWNLDNKDDPIKDLRRSKIDLINDLKMRHGDIECDDKSLDSNETRADYEYEEIKSRSDRGRTKGRTALHDIDSDAYEASSQSSSTQEKVRYDNYLIKKTEDLQARYERLNDTNEDDAEQEIENFWLSKRLQENLPEPVYSFLDDEGNEILMNEKLNVTDELTSGLKNLNLSSSNESDD